MEQLLTRTEFRESCLRRDNFACVICKNTSDLAVHHIVERRLWTAENELGGYFSSNGSTLCPNCHILAEQTILDCDTIREACGITKVILPEYFYDDIVIDKWGNYILPSGDRLRGELFYDHSVHKILKEGDKLHLFTDYVKYPRTYHFEFSHPSKDDKVMKNYDHLIDEEIIATEKLDGENVSMYSDYIHARSLEPLAGEDRGWVKALHAKIAYDIPKGWRICGENLYAKHSLEYTNLQSYFYVFSIWNEKNECLSWNDTIEWCNLLGLVHVPVIYRGKFDVNILKQISAEIDTEKQEGFVVRPCREFSYAEFKNVMIKWVRRGHVTSSNHWRHAQIVPNKILSNI
jgi:hypothetical protein